MQYSTLLNIKKTTSKSFHCDLCPSIYELYNDNISVTWMVALLNQPQQLIRKERWLETGSIKLVRFKEIMHALKQFISSNKHGKIFISIHMGTYAIIYFFETHGQSPHKQYSSMAAPTRSMEKRFPTLKSEITAILYHLRKAAAYTLQVVQYLWANENVARKAHAGNVFQILRQPPRNHFLGSKKITSKYNMKCQARSKSMRVSERYLSVSLTRIVDRVQTHPLGL